MSKYISKLERAAELFAEAKEHIEEAGELIREYDQEIFDENFAELVRKMTGLLDLKAGEIRENVDEEPDDLDEREKNYHRRFYDDDYDEEDGED